ncbi:uncharacterized protein LOC135818127 [Sycon ciliatum]|uniref:uncharacterized protein LOC135818127 n=1 Tax=Sycon ciliatum TaxID=27933 RepID=UPI0031F62BA8
MLPATGLARSGSGLGLAAGMLCRRCIASSNRRAFLDDQLLSKSEETGHSRSDGQDFVPASLMAALYTATSQSEVLNLLDSSKNYGKRHLLAAAARLGDLRPHCLTDSIYTPDDGLYRLEAKLCSRVESFGPHEVCSLLTACSHMALALPNDNLLGALCVQLRSQVKWLGADRLASGLHALAILRSRTMPLLDKYEVLPVLEAALIEHIGELHGLALSKAVWSFHRLLYRSDALWTGLAQQTVRLGDTMQSSWLAIIARCFAEHYGPLCATTELKASVEAMLHHSSNLLLKRHRTQSQFSSLSGLLWAASVLRWPAPHLAQVVANDLQRVSSTVGQASQAQQVTEERHHTREAFAASPIPQPRAARQAASEPKASSAADAIGLKQQSNLLSWALDKTSVTLGGILKTRRGSADRAKLAGLHQFMELQTMGLPSSLPAKSQAQTPDFKPWSAMAVATEGQPLEVDIGTLRTRKQDRQEEATAAGADDGTAGSHYAAQESAAHAALQASSKTWTGMDILGQGETSRLLGNLAPLSSSQLKPSSQASGDRRASAIASSHTLVQHLQRALEEQRKAKAAKEIGKAVQSNDHRKQMELLWPASQSPFGWRLDWFNSQQSADSASVAGGACVEDSELPVMKTRGGLKQLPGNLLADLSQVAALWKSNMFSDRSTLPVAVADELDTALRRSRPTTQDSPILESVSSRLKALGLSCRHGVSLDCYEFDIVADIPAAWLKDPELTVSMAVAVVLTDLASQPQRHSPGYMVLLRRFLHSRTAKDWRLLVIDANEWNKMGGEQQQATILRKRLNQILR